MAGGASRGGGVTSSRSKATGSAAERAVAQALDGIRVGMDGGPVDVVLPDCADLQVKAVKSPPSLAAVVGYIETIPRRDDRLRACVVVSRPGPGRKALRTITFLWTNGRSGTPDDRRPRYPVGSAHHKADRRCPCGPRPMANLLEPRNAQQRPSTPPRSPSERLTNPRGSSASRSYSLGSVPLTCRPSRRSGGRSIDDLIQRGLRFRARGSRASSAGSRPRVVRESRNRQEVPRAAVGTRDRAEPIPLDEPDSLAA